jgi:hypothetical protein
MALSKGKNWAKIYQVGNVAVACSNSKLKDDEKPLLFILYLVAIWTILLRTTLFAETT